MNMQLTNIYASINYHLDPELGGRSDFSPGTASVYRCKYATTSLMIQDMRGKEADFTLEKQGFQIHKHSSVGTNFNDPNDIRAVLYPETAELVKEV